MNEKALVLENGYSADSNFCQFDVIGEKGKEIMFNKEYHVVYDKVSEAFKSLPDAQARYFEILLDKEDLDIYIVTRPAGANDDSMLYKGRKVDRFQKMQFPRDEYPVCPKEIKEGIIIIALRELVYSDTEEMNMINKGIKSFSDGGGLSMSFNTSDSIIGKKVNGISIDIFNGYFAGYSLVS